MNPATVLDRYTKIAPRYDRVTALWAKVAFFPIERYRREAEAAMNVGQGAGPGTGSIPGWPCGPSPTTCRPTPTGCPTFWAASPWWASSYSSPPASTWHNFITFNYAIHSAPKGEEDKPCYHWHLQLIPRLTKAAGLELGSGMYVNVASPEDTAEAMRRAPA